MQYDDNAEKYGYEGEMTTMKCDKLQRYEVRADYDAGTIDVPCDNEKYGNYMLAEDVIAAIAELKEAWRSEHEACEALKKKLEDVQATAYAESVDAGMENRRLKRALWIARAELCRRLDVDRYLRKHINSWYNENCLTWAEACVAMEVKMCKAESKCRAKAEEYK